jgi:hypothetical protein
MTELTAEGMQKAMSKRLVRIDSAQKPSDQYDQAGYYWEQIGNMLTLYSYVARRSPSIKVEVKGEKQMVPTVRGNKVTWNLL